MNLFNEPEPPKAARLDEAYEIFKRHFDKLRAPAKYGRHRPDFVNLAKLRKDMGLQPSELPPRWDLACRNYLLSPLGKYSLADLAVRYDVFVRSPLDRYGKPLAKQKSNHSKVVAETSSYLTRDAKPPDHVPLTADEARAIIRKQRKGLQ